MMTNPFQLADVLNRFVDRSGYTAGQLSKLSGIPKPTIVNWMEGRVRKPRGTADLLQLALVLHLSVEDASALLQAAGHPTITELHALADTQQSQATLDILDKFTAVSPPITPPAPFQALPDLPYFTARQEILAQIERHLLGNAPHKLVSIQGMGGVGKTAVATKIAYLLRHHFPDGVLWAQVRDGDTMSILGTFAHAYGVDVSLYGDVASRSRVVRELLANKAALIVLDDVDSSEVTKPLLPPSGQCAVMLTSRRQDLAIARTALRLSLMPFDPQTDESLQLLTAVLGTKQVMAERPLLTEMADLLGHLPLAIDIAASRLAYEPGWATAEFVQRLRREKRRLNELAYDDQSIRLSFNASFAALDADLQRFFAALSVFGTDDFSDEAAAAVTDVALEDAQDALRQLFALSLITPGRTIDGARPRYRLHFLLQDYARTHLADTAVPQRFLAYFLHVAEQQRQRFTPLALEHVHITQALELAEMEHETAVLLRLTNATYLFWEARGLYEQADRWLALAETAAAAVDDQTAVLHLHFNRGRLAHRLGDYIEAETRYETAVALARNTDDQEVLSHLLRHLGVLAARRGDYVLADAYYKEGLYLTRALGQGGALSDFLRGLGVQAYMRGNYAQAEAFYEEGLALMGLTDAQAKGSRGKGSTLWGLGILAEEQGDFAQAETFLQQALALAEQGGLQERVIVLRRGLAGLYAAQQQRDRAASLYAEALTLAREIGHRWQLARVLSEQGALLLQEHQMETAVATLKELYELARILQSQELIATALYGLAQTAADRGDAKTAVAHARESLDTFISIGHYKVNEVRAWLNAL